MATLGEKRVVVGFNPSALPQVTKIKALAKDLINLINDLPDGNGQCGRWKSLGMTAAEEASGYGVKAATAGQDMALDDCYHHDAVPGSV